MLYEVLAKDREFVIVKVIEDLFNFHFEKIPVENFESWKKGKLEIKKGEM